MKNESKDLTTRTKGKTMKRTLDERTQLQDTTLSKLWLKHSFLGFFNTRIENHWVENGHHNAPAWTDDTSLTINWAELENEIWENLTSDNLVFLVAHELLHILNFTTARRGDRNPTLWNISADYVINADLIHNKTADGTPNPIGEMPRHPSMITDDNPNGYIGCYKKEYYGMTIEQVYDLLYEQHKDEIEKLEQLKQELQDLLDQVSISFGNGNGTGQDEQDEQEKTPEQKELEQKIKDLLDKITGGQIVIDENFGSTPEQDSQKAQEIMADIKAKVQASMKETGKSASQLDSAMARACELLLAPPKFDWKGFLSNYLKAYIRNDSSWKRLSRRTWGVGNLLAGLNTESEIKIAIAIDTSGSIGDNEIKEMLSHIQKIMTSFKSFDIDIFCFSTQVHIETLQHYNKGNMSSISSYSKKLNSYGGTDIKSAFDYIAKNNTGYNVFICMTDGYDNIDDMVFSKCPVVWAITGNDNFTSPKQVKNARVMYM